MVAEAPWLPKRVQQRLADLNRTKINKHGELIITSQRTRSQKQNLDDAFEKLRLMCVEAAQEPKVRVCLSARVPMCC